MSLGRLCVFRIFPADLFENEFDLIFDPQHECVMCLECATTREIVATDAHSSICCSVLVDADWRDDIASYVFSSRV